MAVTFDMSSSYRSDFMISDAAMPQRVGAQIDKEQLSQFAQLLKDSSSVTFTESEMPDSVKRLGASEGVVLSPIEAQEVTGDKTLIIPDNDLELARMILSGAIDIKDIPAERITVQLLRALAIVKKMMEQAEENETSKPKEEDADFFDPNREEASKNELDATALDQLLAILYRFIDAYTDTRYDDDEKKEVIGGIEELIAEFPELADISDKLDEMKQFEQKTDAPVDPIMAHIAKMSVEQAEETEHPVNTDTFVKNGELPPEARTVDGAESETEFGAEMAKAIGEENLKLLDEAAENGELGNVEVKQTAKSEVPEEAKEIPAENVPEAPVKADEAADRAKAISEELEMLRSARLNKNAKPVEEPVTEEKQTAVPIKAADALEAQTPLVFTRRDGTEITVRPADIVDQAAKLIETAISENREQTEYSLVLNPEEMGKITVKMTKAADGAISVTIAAENARTQRILDQNSDLMQSNMRDNGVRLESWQVVRESQQETLAQDYNGSSKNPYYRHDDPKQDDDSDDQKSFADIIAAM